MQAHHVLSGLCLVGLVSAQDPPPPAGGFQVTPLLDRDLTWSDGYRTRVDVYYPRVAPPVTGWPAVHVPHGGGASRKAGIVQSYCLQLARAGYCTFAFDIRGDGETLTLNSGGDLSGQRQLLDDCEAWGYVAQLAPNRLDQTRLCVTGKSQGGRHSCWAAAWSGRPLPRTSHVTVGPRIRAVSPHITSLALLDAMVPQGILMNVQEALRFYAQPVVSPSRQLLLAEQFVALRALLGNDPTYDFLPLLRTSSVPICVEMGWDDYKHQLEFTTDVLPTLPTTTPKKLLLSTIGHGTPNPTSEHEWHVDTVRRWFDRFTKSAPNGVDLEPYCEAAVPPSDAARYLATTSAWPHRLETTWPPAVSGQAMYLRGDGTLAAAPPIGAEAGPTLRHRVQPGYGMDAFLRDGAVAATVFGKIPLAAATFDAPILTAPLELRGRAIVELEVDASLGDFQVQAALLDVPPAGSPRFVASGLQARRGGAAGRHSLRIALNDLAYVVPSGHRLRIALENMNWFRPPGQDSFRYAPYFRDVDVRVPIDAGSRPRVTLPVVPAEASLTPRLATAPVGSGLTHTLQLEDGAQRAGASYAILLGGSGFWPSSPFNGATLWVVPDAWTTFGTQVILTPNFAGFAGTLDSSGGATATLTIPANLTGQLAGTRLTFAALGLHAGVWFGSSPAQLQLVP